MQRTGKILGCFVPTLAALLCQTVAVMIGMVVYMLYQTFEAVGGGDLQTYEELGDTLVEAVLSADVQIGLTAFATALTLLVGALWYRKHRPATDGALREVANGKLICVAVLLGLSMQLLGSLCLSALLSLLPESTVAGYDGVIGTLFGGSIWISMLVTVVLAPLAEELLFRGVTLKKAQKLMPFAAANILQALLFGLYHGNVVQGGYAFLLGLVFGYVAEYFHSIWASVLVHAALNAFGQLMQLLPEQLTGTILGMTLLAVVGVAALFVAVKLFPASRAVQKPQEEKFSENSFDEYRQ